MKPDTVLYTAHAQARAGRDGETRTLDGSLSHRLGRPKELGGNGQGANPEQLFAMGYAACFGSAVEFVARRDKVAIGPVTVTSAIGIGPAGAGFALTADLKVKIEGVDQAVAQDLIEKAHQVCPYSNATRNNIDVALSVDAG